MSDGSATKLETDALRAEVETVTAWALEERNKGAALRAEVERLKDERHRYQQRLFHYNQEIRRLTIVERQFKAIA